jgi:hypothetical protein
VETVGRRGSIRACTDGTKAIARSAPLEHVQFCPRASRGFITDSMAAHRRGHSVTRKRPRTAFLGFHLWHCLDVMDIL